MPYVVYVIKLKDDVRAVPGFAKRNPIARADKPCLYVGSTSLTPEERYEKHRAGVKSNRFVRDYHDGLHSRLTSKSPPYATRPEAEAREAQFAESLRAKGYGVWYGVAGAKEAVARAEAGQVEGVGPAKARKRRRANKLDSGAGKLAKARKTQS
jgi:hypothetical protein